MLCRYENKILLTITGRRGHDRAAGVDAQGQPLANWEMAAVGDPLIDLGILLAYWVHVATSAQPAAISSVTNREGWFTRAEMLERYHEHTGLDLSNITFYEVFAVFKLAVVLQQIFYRYQRGQTDDPRFAALDERVAWLARVAASLAEQT
jgi:aminoglycoside phosphotransferase (APT) family kinase protein